MSSTDLTQNADDPISSAEEDALKRGPFAERLAGVLKAAPSNSSNVFALYGEWGSGKTSVKNLVQQQFEKVTDDPSVPIWIEFNPWAFSTQTELFQSFFSEVSKALGRKDAGDAAVALSKLGSYLSIGGKTAETLAQLADLSLIPGGGVGRLIADTLGKGGKRATEYGKLLKDGKVHALSDVQQELKSAIGKLNRTILIVIDDIDRLPPPQIVQMFQVIRVNASLPRINYLLLLDRRSIACALKRVGYTAEYLEKIVQFAIDLPHFGLTELRGFAELGLKAIVRETNVTIDWNRWHEAYRVGGQYLVNTPRKVRRLLHTFRFHLSMFCQDGVPEVDVTDLFILEVLRLNAPDLWLRLPSIGRALFVSLSVDVYRDPPGNGERHGDREMTAAVASVPVDIRKPSERLLNLLLPQLQGNSIDEVSALGTCRMCTALHFESYFILRTNANYPTQRETAALVAKIASHDDFLAELQRLAERFGFTEILGKLQAVQKNCTDPVAIAVMLGSVWRLQQERAIRPPIDDADNILSADWFSRFFLAKVELEEDRLQVATRALRVSGAARPLIGITNLDTNERKKNPHSDELLFSPASVIVLLGLCFQNLTDLRDKDQLVWHPHLGRIWWLWEEREGRQAVRSWIREQAADDVRLGTILTHFFSRSVGHEVRYYIGREHVAQWIDLDAAMKQRLASVDVDRLDQWQAHAVRELAAIIERAEEGLKASDNPDMEEPPKP